MSLIEEYRNYHIKKGLLVNQSDEEIFPDLNEGCKILCSVYIEFYPEDKTGIGLFDRMYKKCIMYSDNLYRQNLYLEIIKSKVLNREIDFIEGMKMIFTLDDIKSYGY